MIRRPAAEDLEGDAAVEAVRDAGTTLAPAAQPLRREAGDTARIVYWTTLLPVAATPALFFAGQRWPDVFATLEAFVALLALWAWGLWTGWLGPRYDARVADRLAQNGGGEVAKLRDET